MKMMRGESISSGMWRKAYISLFSLLIISQLSPNYSYSSAGNAISKCLEGPKFKIFQGLRPCPPPWGV